MAEVRPELLPEDVEWLNAQASLCGTGLSYACSRPPAARCLMTAFFADFRGLVLVYEDLVSAVWCDHGCDDHVI